MSLNDNLSRAAIKDNMETTTQLSQIAYQPRTLSAMAFVPEFRQCRTLREQVYWIATHKHATWRARYAK